MTRAKIVAGNWKMNLLQNQAKQLTSEVAGMVKDELHNEATVVIIPPFVHLKTVGSLFEDAPNLYLGAQNCAAYEKGAYTGEVSAAMLADQGVRFVVLGHSERRQYFAETSAQIAQKVDRVLENKMQPILCCGETLELRQKGDYVGFVTQQITESLFHLSSEQLLQVVVAYEPIWAIGTGQTATSSQAQDMHQQIRQHIASQYGQEIAAQIPILYGGSVNAENAQELFACPDVDGGLVGGASLKSRDFVNIAKSY
jgi:triosephosphate isomerase (TIM)